MPKLTARSIKLSVALDPAAVHAALLEMPSPSEGDDEVEGHLELPRRATSRFRRAQATPGGSSPTPA